MENNVIIKVLPRYFAWFCISSSLNSNIFAYIFSCRGSPLSWEMRIVAVWKWWSLCGSHFGFLYCQSFLWDNGLHVKMWTNRAMFRFQRCKSSNTLVRNCVYMGFYQCHEGNDGVNLLIALCCCQCLRLVLVVVTWRLMLAVIETWNIIEIWNSWMMSCSLPCWQENGGGCSFLHKDKSYHNFSRNKNGLCSFRQWLCCSSEWLPCRRCSAATRAGLSLGTGEERSMRSAPRPMVSLLIDVWNVIGMLYLDNEYTSTSCFL